MFSDPYSIIHTLFDSPDLENYGQILINFSNATYENKNRTTILNHFYEQLLYWSISKLHFLNLKDGNKINYLICDGIRASMFYLYLFAPKKTSTVKTLNKINAYGKSLLEKFKKPIGKRISEDTINNVLQFLDEKYSFSSKVFSKSEAVFLLLHNTHKTFNSECLSINDNEHNRNLFFLYHMKKKNGISPEAVFFHELGHAIHAQYSGDVKKVPDNVIDILEKLCFPKIRECDNEEQSELFADVLSVGLMFQTPFEKYDSYKTIHNDDKKVFKAIMENIIENM